MSFNLLEERWIPVVSQDWQHREISLMELFATWADLREIQADNPPTTLALHRFLLALLHHVYQGPKNESHWKEIQADAGKKAIADLCNQSDRFDLLHPTRPFMQDSTLTADLAGEIYQAYLLHGNNTSTVFCHEHQWSGDTLSLPAAARLVLRLHLFDVGGRKTGSAISASVIPTMDAANVLVRGNTIQETLMLNLIQYDGKERPCVVRGKDLPAWERESQLASERIPAGYIDYLTYQWRRVRLFVDGDQAVRVAVHAGDRLPKGISPSGCECGIAYVKNSKGLFTVRLNLNRSLWRDSAAFLQSSEAVNCPKIVEWLADLQYEGLINDRLNLQVLGLTVDNAKPLGWMSEQLSVPIAYLKQKSLWQALVAALKFAEEHPKYVFRSFQGSPYHALAKALNHPDAGSFAKSLDGESRYWAMLDRAFQPFLHDLSKDLTGATYGHQELPKWQQIVQGAAIDAFTESIVSIRNYEARAVALRSLHYQLAKLRGEKNEKSGKSKKSTQKSQPKAS